jgi:hypothetical protein
MWRANAVRVDTPSLANARDRWLSTVFGLSASFVAIYRLERRSH